IQRHSEVLLVSSQTGRNDSGTDPFGPNRNELLVTLKPYSTWASGHTKQQLVSELRDEVSREIPGIALNFTQPIIDTATEMITGRLEGLAVIISGTDLGKLRHLAGQTLEMVRSIEGSADTSIEQEADQPGLRIHLDRAQLARYGLNVDDLSRIIESAVG